MEHDKICRFWAETNAHNLSVEAFKQITDADFFEFYKKYQKDCKNAWHDFMRKRRQKANKLRIEQILITKAKRRGEYCTCKEEDALEPNATRGLQKEPIRLWSCPVHGNTCSSDGRYTSAPN